MKTIIDKREDIISSGGEKLNIVHDVINLIL